MEFIEKFVETINSGDPTVRQWFLIRNSYLPFILCSAYAIVSLIGPHFMRNRKPFVLRNIMVVFNFSVVFVYVVILSVAVYYLPQVSWHMFCWGGDLVEGEPEYILVTAAWYGYILKYIEFLDTFFFILRKKENQITFLHVFHHTLVPFIAWLIFRTEKNGLQAIPGILNSIVHVFMYSYYGLSAMGPSVRKYLWWKKYLTQMQIVQFLLILSFVFVVPPITGCPILKLSYLLNVTLAPLFFFLFYRFYRNTFQPSPKKVNQKES